MKNLTNQEDAFMKKLFSEAGSESPSMDFHQRILSRIEANKTIVYQPLISPGILKLLGMGIISLVLITVLFLPGQESSTPYLKNISDLISSPVSISLPKLHFPKIQLGPVFNTSLFAFCFLMGTWIIYLRKKYDLQ
ncbi:hypothetical protein JYB62_17620 [Algoriphagus lutimaris]|uniref:hypothetical protein n=1 Tax=Algoriphagus lutimaris TaxID=613197 RepID=UPI00196AE042|nr:hypothetical protein [Algoriphagus lutimaris]MBN3521831.1 hypothetical protein [Algoriphagus lutimaris]